MTQYVIYRKPAVDDKYYDEYDWSQDKSPVDSREEASDLMPKVGSELAEGYVFKLAIFDDTEEIPNHLTDSEIRKRS